MTSRAWAAGTSSARMTRSTASTGAPVGISSRSATSAGAWSSAMRRIWMSSFLLAATTASVTPRSRSKRLVTAVSVRVTKVPTPCTRWTRPSLSSVRSTSRMVGRLTP